MLYSPILFLFLLCCVELTAQAISPPYTSANRRHVANNLNTLNARGQLTLGLSNLVETLDVLPSSQINDVLDQLHPAPYSSFVELQAAVGGQILTLFHRPLMTDFIYDRDSRVWFDPIGNWLHEGNLGEQTGFDASTKGFASGFETPLGEYVTIGGGLVWTHSRLILHKGRGKGYVNRYLACCYSDVQMEYFYSRISLFGGTDRNDLTRDIQIPGSGGFAYGSFNSLDFAGQFSAAYLFGFPYCYLYPYANCALLFFRGQSFEETGSSSFNLVVDSHLSKTLRAEAGIGFQVQDANLEQTISVVPMITFGWAMECPISRPPYTAHFIKEPLTFEAKGWDHTWQLLSAEFGFTLFIYNFVISGEYITEMSPSTLDDFWDQKGNLSIEYFW